MSHWLSGVPGFAFSVAITDAMVRLSEIKII
jgi:hypothetical protein